MIHQISLAECLEQYSPPAKVLDVSACDDTVFVRICDVDQDHQHETHREIAEISVSLPALIEALALLAGDAEREELRPVEGGGTHETRLSGRRLIVAPTSPHSAVGALKDHFRHTPLPGPEQAKDGGEKEADREPS